MLAAHLPEANLPIVGNDGAAKPSSANRLDLPVRDFDAEENGRFMLWTSK
jgi:hypothetical protein